MKKLILFLGLMIWTLTGCSGPGGESHEAGGFETRKIGELPSPGSGVRNPGLAGAFAGRVKDTLVIAGGSNFPGKMPWEGGDKAFHDRIYVFRLGSGALTEIRQDLTLPEPVAYGASVSLPDGVLCIGGTDGKKCSTRVYLLGAGKTSGRPALEAFPDLPVPLSYASAVLLQNSVYVVGGSSSPDATDTGHAFFRLDLSRRNGSGFGWEALPGYPGPARVFSVAAVQSDGTQNCLFLFGGRVRRASGGPEVLDDGLVFNPVTGGWKTLAAPDPGGFPVMAGAAFPIGAGGIVFCGGAPAAIFLEEDRLKSRLAEAEDGGDPARVSSSRAELSAFHAGHPGFSRRILLYNTITKSLVPAGEFDGFCPVTTNAIPYRKGALIPGGEIKPGIRTPDILEVRFVDKARGFGSLNTAVLILYFLVLVLMGYAFSRKQKDTDDYFKGGKRIPWWAAGLSLFGTALSAITFMAIPAKTYSTDWSYFLFNMSIFLVAPLIIFLFIPFYRALNVTTAYEYLEKRFNLAARLTASVAFILFQVGRMAVILLLPSLALNIVTGMDVFLCIALMGIVSLFYTMLGGLEAVIWTDVLQVIILLSGAFLALVLMVQAIDGGAAAVLAAAVENRKFNILDWRMTLREPSVWVMLIGGLFTNLTTYGTDQTMVQRYIATKTERESRRGVWTNAWLAVPSTILFFSIGTVLFVFYKQYPTALHPALGSTDSIFPWYIVSRLPDGFSGLLIAGIFAAAMSSLSSSMNSAATAYATDIHFRFFGNAGVSRLRTARLATLAAGLAGTLFAVVMATWNVRSLWDAFNTLLGLIIGGVGGLFLLGILSRKANGAGALVGIIASVPVQILVVRSRAVHLLLYTACGVVSCFAIGWLASFLFPGGGKSADGLTVRTLGRGTGGRSRGPGRLNHSNDNEREET